MSASRNTVKKYAFDTRAEKHIIVNGQLMVIHRGGIGGATKGKSEVLQGVRWTTSERKNLQRSNSTGLMDGLNCGALGFTQAE
ncbi:hypothetical protein QVM87_21750 [Providencia stuartii]|nr:hypothetical protein [Providencia stuartii]